MRVWLTFALALGTIAVPVVAKPVQREESKPAKSEQRPLVLASADAVHASGTHDRDSAAPPPKPVMPRVTTCRCGDPDASPGGDGQ